jgi:DNA replication protein DnaC
MRLLILDDFGLDAMHSTESRDAFEILTELHRCASIIVTSSREPDEWLGTFADLSFLKTLSVARRERR